MVRYYFHLANGHETLPDEDGLELDDLAEACAEAVGAIEELRRNDPSAAAKWKGWRLDAADASGMIVFSIGLDDPLR
jgi:hypothetical protein